jgi:drug/metabolite transporter (DMT)-like permease
VSGDILVLVLVSIGLIGSADFFGGVASRRSNSFAVAAWSQWAGVPVIAFVAMIVGAQYIRSDVILGLVAGAGSAVGVMALYRGFSVGSVGIVAPVASTVAAILPIFVGLATGERPSLVVGVGLSAGIVSVALVGYVPGNARLSIQSVLHGLVAGLGFGMMVLAYSATSDASGLAPAVSGRFSAAVLATLAVVVIGAPRLVQRSSLVATLLAGALAGIGMGFFVTASQQGELILVGVAVALFPAVTVTLAAMFLRDRLVLSQWVGIATAVTAVALISVG